MSTREFTNLNVEFVDQQDAQFSKNSALTIQSLLNKLSVQQQTRFLEQFAKLNSAQQNYAYKQFISTPLNVQEFALKQFLTLDPEILIISIDREIEGEKREPQTFDFPDRNRPFQSNILQNQISNSAFLTNQNNELLDPNTSPVRQSRLIDQSRFQTNFLSKF